MARINLRMALPFIAFGLMATACDSPPEEAVEDQAEAMEDIGAAYETEASAGDDDEPVELMPVEE